LQFGDRQMLIQTVFVDAISVSAPGLDSWQDAQSILCGRRQYDETAIPKYIPKLLPANERRRTTPVIKLALQVAEAAMQQTDVSPQNICSVFTTSEGDTGIVDKICTALMADNPMVSPTQFHNSVHNAPAGYWAMATESRQASTSLSGYSGTYAQGLLEAVTMVNTEHLSTLLVAYDYPAPEPLLGAVPMKSAFATAHLLSPVQHTTSLTRLDISLVKDKTLDSMDHSDLEAMRLGNPAARSLPLLQAFASQKEGTVILPYLDNLHLSVKYSPC